MGCNQLALDPQVLNHGTCGFWVDPQVYLPPPLEIVLQAPHFTGSCGFSRSRSQLKWGFKAPLLFIGGEMVLEGYSIEEFLRLSGLSSARCGRKAGDHCGRLRSWSRPS